MQYDDSAAGTRLNAAVPRFVLGHPGIESVIPGALTVGDVRSSVSSLAQPIPHELWLDLRETGLIFKDVPIPAFGDRVVQQ